MTVPSEKIDRVDNERDFYEVLNVSHDASKSLIRESYIRLKSAFSSQVNAFYSLISEQEAQRMAAEIEEAFRVLNDDVKRAAYDRSQGMDSADEAEPAGFMGDSSHDVFEYPFEVPGSHKASEQPTCRGAARAPVDTDMREKIDNIIAEGDVGDGGLYRQLREAAGVSDEEMQDRTKICIRYIRAIEDNSFKDLPQSVFVKGFLRSYLKYLAVNDVDNLVQAFASRHEIWIKENDKF